MLPLQTENGSPGDFPESIYRLLIVQTEVIVCPFVYKEANGSYLFSKALKNELNGLDGLGHLWITNISTQNITEKCLSVKRND
jgi:hypothetical protein